MARSALAGVILLAAVLPLLMSVRAPAQVPEQLPPSTFSAESSESVRTCPAASDQKSVKDSTADTCADTEQDAASTAQQQPSKSEDGGLLSRFWLFNPNRQGNGPRLFGWMDMGYTYASSGSGLLLVAPLMNRFGDEYLLNQLAFVAERPLDQERLSYGYRAEFFSGSDASFLQGPGDIRSSNPRFDGVIRQLYVSAHLPILTEGGVDVLFGRRGSLMGYESYIAPLRPFYSLSYQWDYGEDGADTGVFTTWHITDRLDGIFGVTMGSNTFFTFRGNAPCYIAQAGYWLQEEKKTKVTTTLLMGDQAVGKTTPFAPGNLDTVLEYRLQHAWNDRFTQVLQANIGFDQNVPGVGLGQWYGVLMIGVLRLKENLDTQARLEWFDDVNRTRTGLASNYAAVTSAFSYRPCSWLIVRPELRGDFADGPAFGPSDSLRRSRAQLTAALECVVRF